MNFLSRNKKLIIISLSILLIVLEFFEALEISFIFLFLLFGAVFLIPRDMGKYKLAGMLGSLLNAGHDIVESLNMLCVYMPQYRRRLLNIVNGIRNGQTFAQSAVRHRRLFPPMFYRAIHEGEKRGALIESVDALLDYYERMIHLRNIRKNAFAYPVFVAIIGSCVTFFMLVFVFPTFSERFAQLGATLPMTTRVTFAVANFIGGPVVIVGLLMVSVIYILKRIITKEGFIHWTQDNIYTYLQASIVRKYYIKGIPIEDSLLASAKILNRIKLISSCEHLSNKIRNGMSWAEALQRQYSLPKDLLAAIATGTISGRVEDVFDNYIMSLNENYEFRLRQTAQNLQYTLVIFNGIIWGFVVISMYMPIFKLGTLIK